MSLSPAQLAILRTLVQGEVSLASARTTGDDGAIAAWLNAPVSPAFIVWKTRVSIADTGQAFNGAEWAGMVTANISRLQCVATYLADGYNAALADIRAMFTDIWSGAGGATTRASLLALWKRSATRAEKALATGTGSDVSPATLTLESLVTNDECSSMR